MSAPSPAATLPLATPATPLATAGTLLRVGLGTIAVAVQRVTALAVPVDPVPPGWRPVPVMAFDRSAPVEPTLPTGEPEPAETAAAVVAVAATSSVRAKRASAGSIKSGPPKAPRTRAAAPAVAVVAPVALLGPEASVALEPVAIPADAVPVMAPSGDDVATQQVELPTEPDDLAPLVAVLPAPAAPDKPRVIDPGHSPGVERASSTLAQRIGDDAERLAAIRLEALGWRIVARNLRLIRAEIDLLAIDPAQPPTLVIVEVRRRTRRDFGLAEESVDHRKRAALRRAAGELALRPVLPDGRRLPSLPVRVDLIAIDRGPDGRPSLRHHRGIEL